jgi:hypothetical protein
LIDCSIVFALSTVASSPYSSIFPVILNEFSVLSTQIPGAGDYVPIGIEPFAILVSSVAFDLSSAVICIVYDRNHRSVIDGKTHFCLLVMFIFNRQTTPNCRIENASFLFQTSIHALDSVSERKR